MNKFNDTFFKHDKNPDHVRSLDGLRGIAVLFILLAHSSKCGIYFIEGLDFERSGKYGIYLFFVLSAYLLDRQICLALFADKADSGFWKGYFRKRILRIYPMYIVSLFIYGLLTLVGFETVIDQLKDIPMHLALIKGESIFWSIPVELKYYIVSPIILLICHKYLKWNFALVTTFISVLIIIPMSVHYFVKMPQTSTFGFLPVFFTGTFIAIAELLKKDTIQTKIGATAIEIGGSLCFILIMLTIPSVFYFLSGGGHYNFIRPLLYVPYSLGWGIILLASKYGRGLVKWFLELKFFRFFGVVSYSVYLLHLPVLMYLNTSTLVPQEFKIYVFFIVTSIIGSITFLLIERPCLKIKFGST